MLALIDQDLLCYRCAASAEQDEFAIAVYRIDELLDNLLTKTNATSYRAFLTGPNNFRKKICAGMEKFNGLHDLANEKLWFGY